MSIELGSSFVNRSVFLFISTCGILSVTVFQQTIATDPFNAPLPLHIFSTTPQMTTVENGEKTNFKDSAEETNGDFHACTTTSNTNTKINHELPANIEDSGDFSTEQWNSSRSINVQTVAPILEDGNYDNPTDETKSIKRYRKGKSNPVDESDVERKLFLFRNNSLQIWADSQSGIDKDMSDKFFLFDSDIVKRTKFLMNKEKQNDGERKHFLFNNDPFNETLDLGNQLSGKKRRRRN